HQNLQNRQYRNSYCSRGLVRHRHNSRNDAVLRRLLPNTQFSRSSFYRKISGKLIDSTAEYDRTATRPTSSSSIGSSLCGHWGSNRRTSFAKEDLDVWPGKIVNYQ